MKKILILFIITVICSIPMNANAENVSTQLLQSEQGFAKRVNISLNLSGYTPKGGFKEMYDAFDFTGAKMNLGIAAGYALTEFTEFGVDFNYFGKHTAISAFELGDKLTMTGYSFSAYAKIIFINTMISSDISLQAYIKAAYGRIFQSVEYSYMGLKNVEDGYYDYHSYGGGMDFSLGPDKNLITGIEYRMHNDDDGKFAASLGVNIGCRFNGLSKNLSSDSNDY